MAAVRRTDWQWVKKPGDQLGARWAAGREKGLIWAEVLAVEVGEGQHCVGQEKLLCGGEIGSDTEWLIFFFSSEQQGWETPQWGPGNQGSALPLFKFSLYTQPERSRKSLEWGVWGTWGLDWSRTFGSQRAQNLHDGVRRGFRWSSSEHPILSPDTFHFRRVWDEKPEKESEKGKPERRGRKRFCFGWWKEELMTVKGLARCWHIRRRQKTPSTNPNSCLVLKDWLDSGCEHTNYCQISLFNFNIIIEKYEGIYNNIWKN